LSENESYTLRNEYPWAAKILDASYEQETASLDAFIKICQKIYVEEQNQLKILPKSMKISLMDHY
jgi:hypothetical protein